MAYTPQQLVELFREDMDDVEAPYLWSQQRVYRYLDAAHKAFARRTDLLGTTATVTITAGNPLVDIDPRWTRIRRATLNSTGKEISVTNFADLDHEMFEDDYGSAFEFSTGWETKTGPPQFLVLDMERDKGRLAPYLAVGTPNDQLNLLVYREPTTDIVYNVGTGAVTGTLEVTDTQDQEALLWWMRSLAYGKHDAETANPNSEEAYRVKFLNYCEEAKRRQTRVRRRAGTVRYGGL